MHKEEVSGPPTTALKKSVGGCFTSPYLTWEMLKYLSLFKQSFELSERVRVGRGKKPILGRHLPDKVGHTESVP